MSACGERMFWFIREGEKMKFKVGDIVRITEKAKEYRPWTVTQTLDSDMVIVKVCKTPFIPDDIQETQYLIERADGECFTAVYAGEAYDYQQEGFYESDLELVEGRRF